MNWGRFRTEQMVAALGHWPEAVRYRTLLHSNSLLLTNYCRTYHQDCGSVSPWCGCGSLFFTLIRTQFRLFTLIADLDPDPASHHSWCESATTGLQVFQDFIFKPSRLPCELLQHYKASFWASTASKFNLWCGSWSRSIFPSDADPDSFTIQGSII